MIKGVEVMDALQAKAYSLHIQANPLPSWAEPTTSGSALPQGFSAEKLINLSESKVPGQRLIKPDEEGEAEERDLIDLEIRA